MLKYVLKYGVLFFGVPMLGFLCIMSLFFEMVSDGTPPSIWVYVGIALLGGIFFGVTMWLVAEKNYQRILRKPSGDS